MSAKGNKRKLGSLQAADLGSQVKGMPARSVKPVNGVPKPTRAVTGRLESVHHFRVGDEDHTRAIVWVHRTAKQIKDKEADHREIGGLATDEVEVTPGAKR